MATEIAADVFSPSEREQLLEAIAELCAERGYAESGTEELLERAAVSRESVEALFAGGREECLLVAVGTIIGASAGALARVSGSGREGLLAQMKEVLGAMAARPDLVALGYVVARQMAPPRVRGAYEAGIGMLVVMVERPAERLAQVPRIATRAGVGGAEALLRREIAAGRGDRLAELLPDFVYSATIALVGQEEALALAARGRELLEDPGR